LTYIFRYPSTRPRKYELDYLPSKNYVWKHLTDCNRSFSSEELAEEILKWYLDNGGDPAW